MPRKHQGWITFQSSDEERKILEQYCQESQRTKTEILRELVRSLSETSPTPSPQPSTRKSRRKKDSDISVVQVLDQNAQWQPMKVSARNIIKGKVKRVLTGTVNSEVTLEIAPEVELISIITKASAEELDLSEGQEAYAVIKSSNIMIAKK